jgi:putative Holliday junction resolvase
MSAESSAKPSGPRGRVAGIDYGTVRIGIALADLETKIASPYENYTRHGPQSDREFFKRLADQEKIMRFVVGLPIHLDGGESQKSTEARRFGQWLGEATGVQIEFFDERFTSTEAEQHLAHLTKKQRRARLDKLAAQIMLTAYLESIDQPPQPPRGLDD